MKISFYEDKETPNMPSIFLAGPTLRNDYFENSWRSEAVKYLKELGYTGNVYVPESRTGDYLALGKDFDAPRWEWTALDRSDVIMFWIPRDNERLPGFTTNVEFGRYTALVPEKVILGFPDNAVRMKYLEKLYFETCKRTPTKTLKETIKESVDLINLKTKAVHNFDDFER